MANVTITIDVPVSNGTANVKSSSNVGSICASGSVNSQQGLFSVFGKVFPGANQPVLGANPPSDATKGTVSGLNWNFADIPNAQCGANASQFPNWLAIWVNCVQGGAFTHRAVEFFGLKSTHTDCSLSFAAEELATV